MNRMTSNMNDIGCAVAWLVDVFIQDRYPPSVALEDRDVAVLGLAVDVRML